jgi:catechol 2,3-dioxygenase-like lactoylglutathione lyase family enzyme
MSVRCLDHLNIRTPNFERTVWFLNAALGMRVSPLPQFDSMELTAWAYDESGMPVLHLARADVRYSPTETLPVDPPRGTGAIHHVALSCTDYETMRVRLLALNLTFRENYSDQTGVRQIFVRDPTDILFELNFGAAHT